MSTGSLDCFYPIELWLLQKLLQFLNQQRIYHSLKLPIRKFQTDVPVQFGALTPFATNGLEHEHNPKLPLHPNYFRHKYEELQIRQSKRLFLSVGYLAVLRLHILAWNKMQTLLNLEPEEQRLKLER